MCAFCLCVVRQVPLPKPRCWSRTSFKTLCLVGRAKEVDARARAKAAKVTRLQAEPQAPTRASASGMQQDSAGTKCAEMVFTMPLQLKRRKPLGWLRLRMLARLHHQRNVRCCCYSTWRVVETKMVEMARMKSLRCLCSQCVVSLAGSLPASIGSYALAFGIGKAPLCASGILWSASTMPLQRSPLLRCWMLSKHGLLWCWGKVLVP
mmetsp:Transcript_145132/g.253259  ORF Transcript_145132/g.253259 Transcript_145132/m.253259 type:complete len:207 (+) Transcript_145132:1413-2033(+)